MGPLSFYNEVMMHLVIFLYIFCVLSQFYVILFSPKLNKKYKLVWLVKHPGKATFNWKH